MDTYVVDDNYYNFKIKLSQFVDGQFMNKFLELQTD